MKCPHCLDSIHIEWEETKLGFSPEDRHWTARYANCPGCHRGIILITSTHDKEWRMVQPRAHGRAPLPPEVDDPRVVADYTEACLVLADSPKASAALSRRSLQYLLRDKGGAKPSDLETEIEEVAPSLPTTLGENLNYIRVVGNFAAHPIKSKSTGEVVDVEPGEAEWNLDVLEDLMDHYFVKPARAKLKRAQLNPKLKDAGKPELPV